MSTNTKCEKCGGDMVERTGRYGNFTGCSKYPECKNILKTKKEGPPPEKTGVKCDQCGEGEFLIREGKYGKFKACSNYPKCKNTKNISPETKQ